MLVFVDASLIRLSETNFRQTFEMIICSDRYINQNLTSLISILLYLDLVPKSLTGESSYFCLCRVVASRKEQLRTGHLHINHVTNDPLVFAGVFCRMTKQLVPGEMIQQLLPFRIMTQHLVSTR
jgi:hypothetical protein